MFFRFKLLVYRNKLHAFFSLKIVKTEHIFCVSVTRRMLSWLMRSTFILHGLSQFHVTNRLCHSCTLYSITSSFESPIHYLLSVMQKNLKTAINCAKYKHTKLYIENYSEVMIYSSTQLCSL